MTLSERSDELADRALRGLAPSIAILCAALLAAWVPHYLTWPWFRDLDAFATMAQSWDAGILPYRDIRAYNFPGQIYLLWILGKAFGWGPTAPFYAMDVALLLAVGAALVAWSRARLDGSLPGLVAYLAVLTTYLNLDYSQVAQRDWQAACLTVLALLALEAWQSRASPPASALLAACAFVVRPHVVLFLPAIVSALAERACVSDRINAAMRRVCAAWTVTFLIGLVIAFAPLMLAGVLPDFLNGLGVAAYWGPYNQNSPGRAMAAFVEQLGSRWTLVALAVCPLFWFRGPQPVRGLGRTWSLAMFAVLFYRPLHPVQHFYLLRPIELIGAVAVAVPVAWLVATRSLARLVTLLGVLLIVWRAVPAVPRYASVSESLAALGPLFHGDIPERPPIGAHEWFDPAEVDIVGYRWSDYRAVLTYLRLRTGPETLVANVLRRFPFSPLNAPAGRLSPFMVESGICWMWMIDQDLDAAFARSLERATDAVVVWVPDETGVESRMALRRLSAVIRRDYQVDARFGRIEVWRRHPRREADRAATGR